MAIYLTYKAVQEFLLENRKKGILLYINNDSRTTFYSKEPTQYTLINSKRLPKRVWVYRDFYQILTNSFGILAVLSQHNLLTRTRRIPFGAIKRSDLKKVKELLMKTPKRYYKII